MEVKGQQLKVTYKRQNWVKVEHLELDLKWYFRLEELKELSHLTEALLQELKGEQE